MTYDELPSRGKVTSDGEKVLNHSCGGRCYVNYDEDCVYRVKCENCGDVKKFVTTSLDVAIRVWNSIQKDEEVEV